MKVYLCVWKITVEKPLFYATYFGMLVYIESLTLCRSSPWPYV